VTLFVPALVVAGLGANLSAGEPPDTPEAVHPLLIGAQIPELALTTSDGSPFDLRAAVKRKPAVLIFYRGGW
jgi:hypothetical protein